MTPHDPTDVALRFQSIRQVFNTGPGSTPMPVLSDVSFDVPVGKFISVIGPSGCGKSTLLQMASGLLRPSAGQVLYKGARVDGVNREVGFVPQQAQLLPWKTLSENVEFPLLLRGVDPRERKERAAAVIQQVGLAGFAAFYPYQLSGGMQKRASIARMLVYGPDTILMDEPFGALDAQTRMIMQNDLQALLARCRASVIFVTHDIAEAVLLSDQVVVLSQRPARVIANIAISLPRPRDMFEPHATPGFSQAYDEVWATFRSELKLGQAA